LDVSDKYKRSIFPLFVLFFLRRAFTAPSPSFLWDGHCPFHKKVQKSKNPKLLFFDLKTPKIEIFLSRRAFTDLFVERTLSVPQKARNG
jgi:hypothetical protein